MNQFLCTLRARPTFLEDQTPEERAIIARHFQYLCRLTREGRVLLAGRTQDAPPVGLVILLAHDEPAARAMVDADPAVAAGNFTPELRPFRIALADVPQTLPPA